MTNGTNYRLRIIPYKDLQQGEYYIAAAQGPTAQAPTPVVLEVFNTSIGGWVRVPVVTGGP